MKTTHVVVLPYDPKWKDDFTAIQAELEAALGDLALGIEHVGSTSVEGMAAKPCIDVDVVIPDNSVLGEVIERLAVIGYLHEGNLGIEGREAFRYTDKPDLQLHHCMCVRPIPKSCTAIWYFGNFCARIRRRSNVTAR